MVCFSKRRFKIHHLAFYEIEIKTFGLVLEFEMSFQQQQHSVAFMLLYSDLAGCWDLTFLTEVIAQIWLDPSRGF